MTEHEATAVQQKDMTAKKVWFITGAGRGMGTDIAKAALAAGHAVVATGRNPENVAQAVGDSEDLLAVRLDVTDPADATAAIQAAVDRFGRIDVVVNNAGNFYAGFFEEITPEDFRSQIETTMFGPMNVTRAALAGPAGPALGAGRHDLLDRRYRWRGVPHRIRRVEVRRRRLGRIAGPRSGPVRYPHHARGAGVLPHGTAHPGIHQLRRFHDQGLCRAKRADRSRVAQHGGQQGGDPAKLADALIQLAEMDEPPLRFAAGADAVGLFDTRAKELQDQADAHRELSSNLAHDDA